MPSSLQESAKAKLAELMSQYSGKSIPPELLEAVCSGASGRVIMRCQEMIGVYWTDERADNHSFLPAATALKVAGLQVPNILAQWTNEQGSGACLMTNLGTRDILSFKNNSWTELKELYQLAFESLLPLYQLEPDWELQPAFDYDYYRWEQNYFVEHLLEAHLGLTKAEVETFQQPFHHMAEFLGQLPRVPVHRDCQSQNIMIKEGTAWLIDFQGMRMGRMEYDLASLIYDPYMDLIPSQRHDLLELWQSLSGAKIDTGIFTCCGMQRIIQALGAFANIGYNQKRSWYLNQIPAGLRALSQLMELSPAACPSQELAQCLKNVKNL